MGYYCIAQICENGHVVTDRVERSPALSQPFCSKCGSPTLTSCPACSANIRGYYHVDGVIDFCGMDTAPAYCHNCGKPYPWTQAALEATRELIEEDSELSELERIKFLESLPDIVSETPKTNLAAVRFKKVMLSCGKFTADGMRQFAIDFGCELFKKLSGLS